MRNLSCWAALVGREGRADRPPRADDRSASLQVRALLVTMGVAAERAGIVLSKTYPIQIKPF
jgi:hypothetical protein